MGKTLPVSVIMDTGSTRKLWWSNGKVCPGLLWQNYARTEIIAQVLKVVGLLYANHENQPISFTANCVVRRSYGGGQS